MASRRFGLPFAIFVCALPLAFVSNALAQSSLQIQRDLLDIEQQRLRIEQQRFDQEQQQNIDLLRRQIVNQELNIQDRRTTLLRLRLGDLEKLREMRSSIDGLSNRTRAKSEQLEKDILTQRSKSKLTHPRADRSTHFTEAFQQPLERRRRDIDYIFDRYETGGAEMEARFSKFPAVVPNDFAEPSSTAYEKNYLLSVQILGTGRQINLLREYQFWLLKQESLDNSLRAIRKTDPKGVSAFERSMTEQTRVLVEDLSASADSDAKGYAAWMKLAEQ